MNIDNEAFKAECTKRAPVGAVKCAHPHGLGARDRTAAHPDAVEIGGRNSDRRVRTMVRVAWRPEIAAVRATAAIPELVLRRGLTVRVRVTPDTQTTLARLSCR